MTATQYPCLALNLLRQNSDAYDLVIIDVQMPDMDGFQLLESIVVEMDIPVISELIPCENKMCSVSSVACLLYLLTL